MKKWRNIDERKKSEIEKDKRIDIDSMGKNGILRKVKRKL